MHTAAADEIKEMTTVAMMRRTFTFAETVDNSVGNTAAYFQIASRRDNATIYGFKSRLCRRSGLNFNFRSGGRTCNSAERNWTRMVKNRNELVGAVTADDRGHTAVDDVRMRRLPTMS